MGLFLVYGVEGADAPADDATGWTASTTGWSNFSAWAAALPPGEFPELVYLGEYGEVFAEDGSARAVEALEAELAHALEEKPGPTPEVLGVGKQLLRALRRRPENALAAIITDGTGLDEGDEDEEDEDPDNGLDNGDGPEEVEEEDTPGSLRGVQGKGVSCACGPGCGCGPCKAKGLENEEECDRLQREMLDLDHAIDFIIANLDTRKALVGVKAAMSALAEGTGGGLMGPAGQEHKDHLDGQVEEQLRVRLTELVAKREKLRTELCDRCGVCDTEEGK
jgi:hypothetical protein